MNYVFYETGNDTFFTRISEVFCSIFVLYILINIFNEVLQPGGRSVDRSRNGRLKTKMEYYKKTLTIFNCALFPAVPLSCGNQQCKRKHKIVLTSDQAAVFEATMTDSKISLVQKNTYAGEKRVRINMQEVLESFTSAQYTKDMFEHIVINEKGEPGPHSIDYKRDHPDKYRELYMRQAVKIRDRKDTESLVYVCAETGSNYSEFEVSMKSPGVRVTVTPCDLFQKV